MKEENFSRRMVEIGRISLAEKSELPGPSFNAKEAC